MLDYTELRRVLYEDRNLGRALGNDCLWALYHVLQARHPSLLDLEILALAFYCYGFLPFSVSVLGSISRTLYIADMLPSLSPSFPQDAGDRGARAGYDSGCFPLLLLDIS